MKIVYLIFLFSLINAINTQVPGFGRDSFEPIGNKLNQLSASDRLPPSRIHAHNPALDGANVQPTQPTQPARPVSNVLPSNSNSLNPVPIVQKPVVQALHTPILQNSQMPVSQMHQRTQVMNTLIPVKQVQAASPNVLNSDIRNVLKQLPLNVQPQTLPQIANAISSAQRNVQVLKTVPLQRAPIPGNFGRLVSNGVSQQQGFVSARPTIAHVQRLSTPVRLPVNVQRMPVQPRLSVNVQRMPVPVRLPVNVQSRTFQTSRLVNVRPMAPIFSPRIIPVQNRFVQG